MWKIPFALAMLIAAGGSASAATISTLDQASGQAVYWGLTNTPAYGQTVNLAHAAQLHSFGFSVDDGGVPISYNYAIYSWTGGAPSGTPLLQGTSQTIGSSGFQSYSIDLGNLSLDAGEYVVVLQATSEGSALFTTSDQAYGEGTWVYFEDGWYVDDQLDLGFELSYDDAAN